MQMKFEVANTTQILISVNWCHHVYIYAVFNFIVFWSTQVLFVSCYILKIAIHRQSHGRPEGFVRIFPGSLPRSSLVLPAKSRADWRPRPVSFVHQRREPAVHYSTVYHQSRPTRSQKSSINCHQNHRYLTSYLSLYSSKPQTSWHHWSLN